MAKTIKRQVGDVGEGVACTYLKDRGYCVLERNYLKPWGEIDIVAQKAHKLHFIEVKSVSVTHGGGVSHGTGEGNGSRGTYRPEENVHPAKLKRLHRAIQTYLIDHKVPQEREWQIDVACVYLDFGSRKAKVEVLENVIL
jgi:putative endonuclease